MDLFSSAENIKLVKDCNCGEIEGKKVILGNFSRIGITTEFQDNGVFKNHSALYVDNNFCPQCGTKYKIVNELKEGEHDL